VIASIKRLAASRSWRKFTANRMAMVCVGVIAVYLLVALAGLLGIISRQDTQVRVLPDQTPGFLEKQSFTERATDARWYLDRTRQRVDRALDDPEAYERLMTELALAERVVIDVPLEEFAALLAEAEARMVEVNAALDLRDAILDDQLDVDIALQQLERRNMDAAAKDARRAELLAERAEISARLPEADAVGIAAVDEVKDAITAFQPMPTGMAGAWYTLRTSLGSDGQGRSIAMKALFSVRIAFQVGFVVAVISVIIGTILGAAAGFYGGWVDYLVMYLVSVLSSIPTLVLLGVLVYMFFGHPLFDNPAEYPGFALVPVYCAMCLTFWVSTCRVIRGEVMKIKNLEYVQAATSIGFGRLYILFRHVVPNTAHLMFINLSLLFIGAIKSEVILSFLGLGVKGQPSWGVMISQAKDDISVYFFWEVVTASALMFGLVLAFNVVSDALQDAFDPKHVS
jgi:peptide/nickel transport system permease protein